jgi:hypothetical protein
LEHRAKPANAANNVEIFFDTSTAQYEGVEDEPPGAELQRLTKLYVIAFPRRTSAAELAVLIYVRAQPT